MALFIYFLLFDTFGLFIQQSICIELYHDQSLEKQAMIFSQKATDVHKYQLVYVKTFQNCRKKRDVEHDSRLVQFEIDRKKYDLKLVWRRRSVFAFSSPVWLITSLTGQNSNYTYKKIDPENVYFEGIFFEDSETMASLIVRYDQKHQQFLYDGIFGLGTEMHVIKSVPEKWETPFNNRQINDHLVYKVQSHKRNCRSAFKIPEDSDTKNLLEMADSVLHVKILPVIDYQLFKLLNEDIKESLQYVMTFWNAVDMQLSKIDSIKIEITITGIAISTDEHTLSFLNRSRYNSNRTMINAHVLLEEARMFFYENFINDTGFTNYDAIFLMTALNTKPSAGMSYIGRICNRLYSTAFIQDDANYLGLHSATHELGHLLNFFHDGSDEAKNCEPYPQKNVRTVMAPFITKVKSILWSQCSKRSLEKFVKTKAAKCLRETYRIK